MLVKALTRRFVELFLTVRRLCSWLPEQTLRLLVRTCSARNILQLPYYSAREFYFVFARQFRSRVYNLRIYLRRFFSKYRLRLVTAGLRDIRLDYVVLGFRIGFFLLCPLVVFLSQAPAGKVSSFAATFVCIYYTFLGALVDLTSEYTLMGLRISVPLDLPRWFPVEDYLDAAHKDRLRGFLWKGAFFSLCYIIYGICGQIDAWHLSLTTQAMLDSPLTQYVVDTKRLLIPVIDWTHLTGGFTIQDYDTVKVAVSYYQSYVKLIYFPRDLACYGFLIDMTGHLTWYDGAAIHIAFDRLLAAYAFESYGLTPENFVLWIRYGHFFLSPLAIDYLLNWSKWTLLQYYGPDFYFHPEVVLLKPADVTVDKFAFIAWHIYYRFDVRFNIAPETWIWFEGTELFRRQMEPGVFPVWSWLGVFDSHGILNYFDF